MPTPTSSVNAIPKFVFMDVSSLDKFTPGRLGRSWSGGRGGARHEEPETISLLRVYKIAHVALYFGIFGPWGFLATFICDASTGLAGWGGWIRTLHFRIGIRQDSQPGRRDS